MTGISQKILLFQEESMFVMVQRPSLPPAPENISSHVPFSFMSGTLCRFSPGSNEGRKIAQLIFKARSFSIPYLSKWKIIPLFKIKR
jgi:hypothetical protein